MHARRRINKSSKKAQVNSGSGNLTVCICLLLALSIGTVLVFLLNVDPTSPIENKFEAVRSGSASQTSQSGSIISLPQGKDTTNSEIGVKAASNTHVANPPQKSKFAYTTLISGINSSFRYRGFLYNTLIMKKALVEAGSTADFIALIGFSSTGDTSIFEKDLDLLRANGIIVHYLPRFQDEGMTLNFAEMALLKVTPWSFTHYDRVQFFDGDVMPTRNMDCFFELDINSFTVGAVSPLNSGWYLAIPNEEDFKILKSKAMWRLKCDWDQELGWAEKMSDVSLQYRGGSPCEKWDFNGADMDQGLLAHYFVINKGGALLVDTDLRQARRFDEGLLKTTREGKELQKVPMGDALACCGGVVPTSFFAHFTGRSKPWMVDEENKGKGKQGKSKPQPRSNPNVMAWMKHLDSLKLPVNSSNVKELGLGSPLGFFNANFPKKNNPCHKS